MVTRTEDLDSLLARIPDPAIRALFSGAANGLRYFARLTIGSVLRLVHALDWTPDLSGGASARQILERHGYTPRAAIPVRWFLHKLADSGYLSASSGESRDDSGEVSRDDRIYTARGPLPPGDPDRAEAQARALDPGSAPAFAVVRAMVEHARVPPGRADRRGDPLRADAAAAVVRLLLQRQPPLPDQQPARRRGRGAAFRPRIPRRPRDRRRLRPAALAVGERLARDGALARIGLYRFTEVVPTFLRRAERSLRARFPGWPLEFSRLDMDKDFVEQGVPPEAADVVYAVNTVHIARDLQATLARIRGALRPGGQAVF